MDLGLEGKAAVVTGASRGIGRAIAIGLAKEGARVALIARGQASLAEAVRACGPGALGISADLATPEGCDAAAHEALDKLGGADVLVNNVGGSGARTWSDTDPGDLAQILDRNLWPAFRMSRALAPSMKSRGGGAIVMITSIWGREAGGGPSYNVAKAAEMSLAKAMARELAKDAIRVNAVAPGSTLFPGGGWEKRMQADPVRIAAFVERELPFGRFGRPEEVADAVVYLCSARASWIAGACLCVDGAQSRAF